MKRSKILSIGLGVFLLSSVGLVNDVLADRKGGGGKGVAPSANASAQSREGKKNRSPASNPEPLSCVLLLAGGATLAALRRFKNKRGLGRLEKQHS